MNKQEIENKLEEILYKDKELIEDIVDGKLSYGIATSFLKNITEQIFNFALELAAKNVKTKWNGEFIEIPIDTVTVDKESILKLKL